MIGGAIQLPRINTGPFNFSRKQARKVPDQYVQWLERVSPRWHWRWKYQLYIQSFLDQITAGQLSRLMLFVPPRHGKSEMVTIRYPVYRLERKPESRVIVGAYNQTLAEKFSRKARKLATDRLAISQERKAVEEWETLAGGGLRATGVGGGVTGMGADLLIIDDPVKSRKEANSKTYRDTVYDWYTDDLYTRLEPGGAIILIMTRWHEDDLAGRILRSDEGKDWTVVNLPAEAEANDPLGRKPGEALNPERYPVEELQKIKNVLKRSYYALYQQRPQEQEGDFFKRSWFLIDALPPVTITSLVRYWDKASTKDGGDWTAGVLMGRYGSYYIILDIVRGQWSTGERDKHILETADKDKKRWGRVMTVFEQEPGSSGVDAGRAMVRLLSGYPVELDKVTGDKSSRAEPFASQAEYGFVSLLRAAWNEDFIDELTAFPNGAHDDQLDGASGAFNKLSDLGATHEDVRDLGKLDDVSNPFA